VGERGRADEDDGRPDGLVRRATDAEVGDERRRLDLEEGRRGIALGRRVPAALDDGIEATRLHGAPAGVVPIAARRGPVRRASPLVAVAVVEALAVVGARPEIERAHALARAALAGRAARAAAHERARV